MKGFREIGKGMGNIDGGLRGGWGGGGVYIWDAYMDAGGAAMGKSALLGWMRRRVRWSFLGWMRSFLGL